MAKRILVHCSEQEMLQAIADWRFRKGCWPLHKDMRNDDSLPDPACCKRFGGMDNTKKAVRIMLGELTSEEMVAIEAIRPKVLAKLQHVADLLAPKRVTMNRLLQLLTTPPRHSNDMPTLAELACYCGGLDSALRMLGLPVSKPTHEDLIKVLKQATESLGTTPRQNDCEDDIIPYSANVFQRAFGSWNNALIAAGLELNLDQPNRRQTMLQKRAHLQARE